MRKSTLTTCDVLGWTVTTLSKTSGTLEKVTCKGAALASCLWIDTSGGGPAQAGFKQPPN